MGQYLAAGSYHPLSLPPLLNPLRRASAGEFSSMGQSLGQTMDLWGNVKNAC